MDETPQDHTIRTLEDKIRRQEGRLEELTRALYGHPELGQQGFREQVNEDLQDLRREIRETKRLCEQIKAERQAEASARREELAERRGRDQVISRTLAWVGGSSLFTLLTVIVLLITIWRGGVFGA